MQPTELTNNFMTLGQLYPCNCCMAALTILDVVQVQRYCHLRHNETQYDGSDTSKKREYNMAYVNTARTSGITLSQRFAALRENFAAARAQRKIYTTTVNELEMLSNRDLDDLGISRSMIKAIALEAAYGN